MVSRHFATTHPNEIDHEIVLEMEPLVRYYPTMSAPAEKISITVTPAMKRVLEERVASGQFASASELMREAFRTWQRQQDEHEERLASLRARIDRSMNDPRPGIPAEEVFDRLKKMHEKNLKAAS